MGFRLIGTWFIYLVLLSETIVSCKSLAFVDNFTQMLEKYSPAIELQFRIAF